MHRTPLANLKQTADSVTARARGTGHKFKRAHGRVVRVQTLAAANKPQFLLSVLLPPLGVFLKLGFAPEIVFNLLLTLCGTTHLCFFNLSTLDSNRRIRGRLSSLLTEQNVARFTTATLKIRFTPEMFSTNNSNTQKPSSSATTTNTTDRSTQQQSSYNPNQQQASTQGPTSQQKSSTQPTRATEPYPTQESTWWEEAPSPDTHRMEQGYGRGGGMGGHEQRQEYGQYSGRSRDERRARENQGVIDWNKVAKIICAIFLPPLGVFLETGCDKSFAINVLLTILGYLPGIIHAIYVIFTD